MNHAFHPSPTTQRLHDGSIAWEALPSLSHLVRDRRRDDDAPSWQVTRPADLDTLAAMQPFHEALEGLAVREVHEPEVFEALFGAQRRA